MSETVINLQFPQNQNEAIKLRAYRGKAYYESQFTWSGPNFVKAILQSHSQLTESEGKKIFQNPPAEETEKALLLCTIRFSNNDTAIDVEARQEELSYSYSSLYQRDKTDLVAMLQVAIGGLGLAQENLATKRLIQTKTPSLTQSKNKTRT